MSEGRTFVSYSRSDAEFAVRLAADLRTAGADVWVDQLDIKAGARWDSSVEQALRQAIRVLVVLSPKAVSSQNVLDEVSFALDEGKAIVPVLVEQCSVPLRLRRLHYIDFTRDYGTGLERLLPALGVSRQPEIASSSPPATPPETLHSSGPAPSMPSTRASAPNWPLRAGIAMAAVAILAVALWSLWPDKAAEAGAETQAATSVREEPPSRPDTKSPSSLNAEAPEVFGVRAGERVGTGVASRRPDPADDVKLNKFRVFASELQKRDSLSESDFQRLADAEMTACQAAANFLSCTSVASDISDSAVRSVCAKKLGAAPPPTDETAKLKYDIDTMTCQQPWMSFKLRQMDEKAKDAISKIKAG
jgi:hypothetical protein